MRTYISRNSKGVSLIFASVLLAALQLIVFDHVIANSAAGFTDGTANDTIVFSPLIDATIILIIFSLFLSGTYFALNKIKQKWLRTLLSFLFTFVALLGYIIIWFAIQQHLSGYNGV